MHTGLWFLGGVAVGYWLLPKVMGAKTARG